jgi:hypothetical protein
LQRVQITASTTATMNSRWIVNLVHSVSRLHTVSALQETRGVEGTDDPDCFHG